MASIPSRPDWLVEPMRWRKDLAKQLFGGKKDRRKILSGRKIGERYGGKKDWRKIWREMMWRTSTLNFGGST